MVTFVMPLAYMMDRRGADLEVLIGDLDGVVNTVVKVVSLEEIIHALAPFYGLTTLVLQRAC